MNQLATKEEVNYRQGDEETNCGACVNFASPDSCNKVQGIVALMGLCDLFEPPADEQGMMNQLFGSMSDGTANEQ